MAEIGPEVQAYRAGIDPAYRPLFDRIHALITAAYPSVTVTLSYGIPTYRVSSRRLSVGVWKHGLSLYGRGLASCRPDLATSRGTVRLRPADMAGRTDDDLGALLRIALGR